MDKASEWQIYARIVLPLTLPALAVLAIFSIMWRWNEFLWPLAVLTKSEVYTLQIGLNAFQGELQTQWHYLLAMTVMTSPGGAGFRVPPAVHHHGHREYGDEVMSSLTLREIRKSFGRSMCSRASILRWRMANSWFRWPLGLRKIHAPARDRGTGRGHSGTIAIDGADVTREPAAERGLPWCSSPTRSTRI